MNNAIRKEEDSFDVSIKTILPFDKDKKALGFTQKVALVPVESIFLSDGSPAKNPAFAREKKKKMVLEFRRTDICLLKTSSKTYTLLSGGACLVELVERGANAITGIVFEGEEAAMQETLALISSLKKSTKFGFFETAERYRRLLDITGVAQHVLATWINVSQPSIGNKVRLLQLPDDVRDAAMQARLTERHCRALLDIGDSDIQLRVISYISQYSTCAKKAESIRKLLLKKKNAKVPREQYLALIDRLFMVSGLDLSKEVTSFLANLQRDVRVLKSIGVDAELTLRDRGSFWSISISLPK